MVKESDRVPFESGVGEWEYGEGDPVGKLNRRASLTHTYTSKKHRSKNYGTVGAKT